ncbi:glycosyltransferase involved in cell wall biosynthesis [Bacillus tianshenii]|uniref:Glycosyltransferase involved in cell wall biosynthesis n=1 Tax=Sutcliffiella tianshenii TaxID=1463404 RepID=A0ABS2NUH1_9BACI|nr:glycosyltransferase family 2 protein [Bacillus tianshenii]MBM7618291.1 glycosyltransferase involved in cell wall biosynthesis [Bacillus tianshenii]
MNTVSVIVPIYNAGKYLKKCINSILKQTYKEIEVVLVNDGSTDNSLDICEKFTKIDKRVKLINKNNEGCIATRRKGLEVSNSPYIMFVDADDWIHVETVETLLNAIVQSNSDIAVCDMYKVIGNSAIIKHKNESIYFRKNRVYEKIDINNELVVAYLHGHPFPSNLCAKLYKKELLITSGKYLNRIHFFGEDLYYNLEMLLKSNRVKVINRPLYYYRFGGTSSKYMSYLFNDAINGYQIQKEVIEDYFLDSKQKRYNGVSIMLLNTLRTCLMNLFFSNLSESDIYEKINEFVKNKSIRECLKNEGCRKYFPNDYLNAIEKQNLEFLYKLGEKDYKKQKPRKIIMKLLSNVC